MAKGPPRNDSMEVLMLIGALSGLCLLIAGSVTDLSMRIAKTIAETEQSSQSR
ncbi:hypothetical protein HKCCE3408_18765 [Rhodobacterales bacterium HKCCE3408]|nr:hypothetical protein [Rhodobacterales bacterium HKCCE3408]